MTKKTLLEQLEKIDDDAIILIQSGNPELRQGLVPVKYVFAYNDGEKDDAKFVDTFDGESFNHEIYNIHGGKLKIAILRD